MLTKVYMTVLDHHHSPTQLKTLRAGFEVIYSTTPDCTLGASLPPTLALRTKRLHQTTTTIRPKHQAEL